MAGTERGRITTPLGPRGRRVLAVALVGFLVLSLLAKSWGFAAMAAIWLLLLVAKELVDRRNDEG